jgi:hypothetical protein
MAAQCHISDMLQTRSQKSLSASKITPSFTKLGAPIGSSRNFVNFSLLKNTTTTQAMRHTGQGALQQKPLGSFESTLAASAIHRKRFEQAL